MSDDNIKFGTLHPDGTVTNEQTLKKSAIMACPHLIMTPEHYRENGICLCDDVNHTVMAEWGYVWNDRTEQWEAPAEEA